MLLKLLPVAVFRARRLARTQPGLCFASAGALALFLLAGMWLASASRARDDAEVQLAALQREWRTLPATMPAAISMRRPSLQPFNSAQVVDVLNKAGVKAGLAFKEVGFTLDDSKDNPYLRYQIALTVSANYLAIRRFTDTVHASLPDVALDSIRCSRESISAHLLKCDLTFSSFYRRGVSGQPFHLFSEFRAA
jgi:hypothetical protein